jgi:hypothetical protein
MPLLRIVSNRAPWNLLVPLLLLRMTVTGFVNFAEELFVSTCSSSRASKPGTRPKSHPSQTSFTGAPSKSVTEVFVLIPYACGMPVESIPGTVAKNAW